MDSLALPFTQKPWPSDLQDDVNRLWDWHLHWFTLEGITSENLQQEAQRFRDEEPLQYMPTAAVAGVRASIAAHRLDAERLAQQIEAAAVFQDTIRFATRAALGNFLDAWIVPHVQGLAQLADADGSWQRPYTRALAHSAFLTRRLLALPQELARGWCFIPEEDLTRYNTTHDALQKGDLDDALQKVLWRQIVWIRDGFAQARPLLLEVNRRYRRALKQWWLHDLTLLHMLERRRYDLWSAPITLSKGQRAILGWQSRFAKTITR